MTETLITVVSRRASNTVLPPTMPYGTNLDGSLVWNFEFELLGFV
jgi:hypothetical protein